MEMSLQVCVVEKKDQSISDNKHVIHFVVYLQENDVEMQKSSASFFPL